MSNKEAYYFSHDSNARQDEKLIALRMKHGWEGYGLYWALIEKLRESSEYMSVCDYNIIAYDLRTDAAKIKSIIEDYRLFSFTEKQNAGKCFYSESLKNRMEKKSSKARELAEARFGKKPERQKANECIFYVIEVFNESEKFIKCGITSESVSRRYSGKLNGYQYKLITQKEMSTDEAIKCENIVSEQCEKYKPFIKFAGYLECYKHSDLVRILNFAGFRNAIKGKESKVNNITTNSINNLYNYSFVEIDDFHALYKKFEFEKKYLFLAYRFWEMWNKENPNQKTMTDAKISKWYDAIRLIVEVDKQKPDKLVGVYCYFLKCAAKESGFDDFWFKTVKSVSAFRKKDKDEVYFLDKIISRVNDKIAKDQDFSRLVQDTIKKFNK